MTNAQSLASVVTALGGTPSGTTNAELLAEIVTALGGTPSPGDTNDELIAKIAENASGGGGGSWRLWSGDPDAEPLADATTKKWLVDCEIYARTTVADLEDQPVMECWRFWRKGDDAEHIYLAGFSAAHEGSRLVLTGCGALEVSSLTPEGGNVDAGGTYYHDAATPEDAVLFDPVLAFNDEEQPDRVMVWIR